MMYRKLAAAAAVSLLCMAAQAADAPFAKVGDVVITRADYDTAFAQAARSKFYHGKPPEAEVAALQREVAYSLVDDVLLAKEAKRRKLQADAQAVQRTIDEYEQRYAGNAQWQANRAKMLPAIRARLERDSVIQQLKAQVQQVAEPTARQLERYWQEHPDKFTSPEQVHVAMILLKVDPSSPQSVWEAARAEGAAIHKRLAGGADFAELAKLHSGDASAASGGDLGYLHKGMLPDPAQAAVDQLKPGEISEPVLVLEGVAVLRLAARQPPVLNPLEAVRQRVRDLLVRDQAEAQWNALIAQLRHDTPVKFDDAGFLPL